MGEVFAGRYELIDPIASGGMGTVWRVHDREDGRVKAAKILRQSDAATLLRFVREQSVRIDHSHIVAPQSWAGMDDRVLFTMPLVRGGSVGTLLKRYGALPPRWIGLLVDQTLQALDAVHGAGIVHRDVKPGNLLLEPTGTGQPHVRLTDFGIAVPEDEPRLTATAMAIGTPGYMAPEQRMGADPAPGADIYALGMVTLQLLTGERPPTEPGPIELGAARARGPHHEAVAQLVEAMTQEAATDRPTAAALRAHPALRALLALPADPAEGIEIPDEFATAIDVPTRPGPPPPPPAAAPTMALGATSYPPPPPPAAPTRVDHAPAATPTRSGAASSYVLLAVGAIGLLASAWLFLGG